MIKDDTLLLLIEKIHELFDKDNLVLSKALTEILLEK